MSTRIYERSVTTHRDLTKLKFIRNVVAACTFGLVGLTTTANAATIFAVVDARQNSSTAGVGLATGVILNAGDMLTVSAELDDVWSLGTTQSRTTNADGLSAFGLHTQNGFSELFGTLVGQIGTGNFFALGTSFDGIANASGELRLFNWDENNFDNSGEITASISADISPVPLPASSLLLLSGLCGLVMKRKRKIRA